MRAHGSSSNSSTPVAPVLLDGGLGTELERRGHTLSDHLWSARLLRDDPQAIAAVHADYLLAGSNVIATASYQASVAGFRQAGLEEQQFAPLLRKSVHIARVQRDLTQKHRTAKSQSSSLQIAASIGPYGACLANGAEYTGDYQLTDDELHAFHADRWNTLASCQPDLMLCETIPNLQEARILCQLAEQTWEQLGIPTWLSFSCRDELHISDGTAWAICLEALEHFSGLQAVGANCLPPSLVSGVLRQMKQSTDRALMIYPNSGEHWNPLDRRWTGEHETVHFADAAVEWNRLGATIIGGCCRTTPDHIRAIAQRFTSSGANQI